MYKFYQHLLLSVLMLLSINTVFSQTTYYSQGTNQSPSVLSNWNTAANGSGSPATDFTADNGDTYIIQSGHSMVTTANWLPEGITLQIDAGASLTVVSNHAVRLLTGVSGLGGDGILVLGGSYIHNSSAAIHNSILGSNLNTYDAGSTIVIGSTQSFTRVVSCVNLTISSGISVTTTKNIQLDGILDLQSGSTLTMNAASSCNIVNLGSFAGQTGTGTLNTISTASSPIPPSSTWAGTINYNNSSTSQTIVSGDYTNLNGTGSSRTLGATIKISNTFTPGSGTYTSTGSTIEYNGTAAQNIAAFAYYNNLTISNSAVTVGASGNITVGGALTVNGGIILDMGTNAISGSLTTLGTGTIKTQKTTAALPSGRSWSQTVEYNAATGSQAIIDGTYANLTLSNSSGTQTASGTITVTSNLTVASGGTFDLGTNQLATVGGTIAGTGTIKTQKTASAIPTGKTWTQTVEYYAATGGQSIIVGTYPSLVLSNTSGTQSAAGNITVTNNLTIATGGTFDMVTYVLSGLAGTISGTGSLATQETSTTPLPSGKTWTGTVLYNSSSSQTIVQGTYIDLNASNGNRTLASSGNVNISGSFTAGSGTYTSTGSTVVFNATGSQNIPALTSSSYNNLTVSSTGTKSLTGDVTIAGTLTTSASTDFVAINGHTLTLQGSTSMSGSFKGSSTSNLTVSGSGGGSATIAFNAAATDSLMNTITLNRTGAGAGLTLGSDVAITNLLTITAGTFAVNGKIVTLKSTSITNTAQVGPVGGSITYGSSGSFTTERYIPNSPLNNRAYRDLAPMVNTNSNTYIFNTWQESGSSAAGLGTHITGVAGVSPGGVDATTGLDITGSGAASLYTFVNGTWTNVTNTKTTKPDVYQGYRILIRGDRTVNLYTTPTPTTMNAATTMRTNGEIITGSVTYSTLGVVNTGHPSTYSLNTNNTNGDFSIVANPYPCAINWNSIGKTNLLGTYWIYDPNIGTSGGYVTFDGATTAPGTSNANQYLQPGQAFFVQTTLPSPILLIQESDKAPGSTLTGVFRTTSTNKLGVNLSKFVTGRGNIVMDGSVVVFTPTDNNGVDANDAEKISNGTENIFVSRGSKNISIEHRSSSTTTDTIPLQLNQISNSATYTLTVDTRNFTSTNSAYLIDKYLATEKAVKANDTTNISFTANTGTAASFTNRFFIVFRASSTLPLSNISLKAFTKNNGAQIEWNTTNETQLASYEVEKSLDGTSFNKIGSVAANNGLVNSYELFDQSPQKGTNYYRIRIINQNGAAQYSKTILLNLTTGKSDITIYPNPVRGNNLSLQLNNMPKGNYTVEMFNTGGQLVFSQAFALAGSTGTQMIDWSGKKLAVGHYVVSITTSEGNKISKPLFIEE